MTMTARCKSDLTRHLDQLEQIANVERVVSMGVQNEYPCHPHADIEKKTARPRGFGHRLIPGGEFRGLDWFKV